MLCAWRGFALWKSCRSYRRRAEKLKVLVDVLTSTIWKYIIDYTSIESGDVYERVASYLFDTGCGRNRIPIINMMKG